MLDPATGSLEMAVPDMRHDLCWPTVWLKADVPGARLLSLEYAAPASGWEVQTLSPSPYPLTQLPSTQQPHYVQPAEVCVPTYAVGCSWPPQHGPVQPPLTPGTFAGDCWAPMAAISCDQGDAPWRTSQEMEPSAGRARVTKRCKHCVVDTSRHLHMQGESLPLWGTVGQLMDQLTAAGVGERPVVFVCHR